MAAFTFATKPLEHREPLVVTGRGLAVDQARAVAQRAGRSSLDARQCSRALVHSFGGTARRRYAAAPRRHANEMLWFLSGIERMRLPVAAKNALSTAGAATKIVGSPTPPQKPPATATGIGLALHEWLPLYEDGPGDGTWNFNRYHLPRGSDVAVWAQTAEVLPPLSDDEPPKGMAEVAGIPIMPAIVNGIAHAIGHRFRTLPVTPERILEVLA